MDNFTERLLGITKNCREDMHEPDEQGISAFIIGDHLDNAFGDSIIPELLVKHCHEYQVMIYDGVDYVPFNLATMIAYTRAAIKSGITI